MAFLKILQRLGALFVIMGAVFLVYWPAQRNGFVWDDTALALRDPLIRSWRLIPEAFGHFLFLDATASNFYRPLQRLSFMGDYALWHLTPQGFHLTSLYVHMAAAAALAYLGSQLLALAQIKHRLALALGVAVLWAIHPLHTSAITYVAGRADPLAAFFGFAALGLGLRSLAGDGRRARLAGIGAALGFLGALLSKESGVFAQGVWLLRLAWRRPARRVWLAWGVTAALVLATYGALRLSAQKIEPPRTHLSTQTPTPGPVLAARAWAGYAQLFIAPQNLHMERDVSTRPGIHATEAAAFWGVGLALGVLAWAYWASRRAPVAAFCLLALAAAYLPISNVFPLNATFAEHWFYVPAAFLLLALAATANVLLAGRRWALWTLLPLSLWAVWLGIGTWRQQAYWRDPRAFLNATIAAGGDTARMRVNLANLEAAEGRPEEAAAQYHEALGRQPGLPFALLGMASLEIRRGNYAQARDWLDRARREPFIAAECLHMNAILEFLELKTDPVEGLRSAVAAAPRNWAVRKRFILALHQSGRTQEAVRELRTLLEREAFRADSWQMLGDLLAAGPIPGLALEAYERATELDIHDDESATRRAALERRLTGGTP